MTIAIRNLSAKIKQFNTKTTDHFIEHIPPSRFRTYF